MIRWIRDRALAAIVPLWLVLSPSSAWAAPLRLEDVLASVEQTHPGLEAANRDVDKASGQAFAARGGFDPTLTIRSKWTPIGFYNNGQVDTLVRQATPAWGAGLFAGYRIGWGTYPVYKGDLQTLSGGEVRAGIDVPLWRNGPIDARRAKIKQTRIRERGAQQTADATRLQLQRDAADAYWTWVAAGQSLHVARDLLAIAERRDAGLNEQAAEGAIERIALVDNRRLVLSRMAKVVTAERKFKEASLKLSLYLRDADQNPVRVGEERVPDDFPEPRRLDASLVDGEIRRAMQRRPDIGALRAERKAAKVGVKLARNQRAPGVNVQTFVAKDFGDGPAELGPTEWGAGAMLEVPIPLRQARGELRAAKAEVASIDAKLRGVRDKVAADVRAAHVALEASHDGVTLARQQVAAADELAEAERIRLREGATNLVIVNLREIAAAEAATQEIEALAEYQRSRAGYLTSIGRAPTSPL